MATRMDGSQPVRVATYVRARDSQALAAQASLLRQFVSDHSGWELMIELSDSDTRQGLHQMLQRAREGTYDLLLVHSLTRLSRQISDLSRILQALQAADVTVHSISEPLELNGPVGRPADQGSGGDGRVRAGQPSSRATAQNPTARER